MPTGHKSSGKLGSYREAVCWKTCDLFSQKLATVVGQFSKQTFSDDDDTVLAINILTNSASDYLSTVSPGIELEHLKDALPGLSADPSSLRGNGDLSSPESLKSSWHSDQDNQIASGHFFISVRDLQKVVRDEVMPALNGILSSRNSDGKKIKHLKCAKALINTQFLAKLGRARAASTFLGSDRSTKEAKSVSFKNNDFTRYYNKNEPPASSHQTKRGLFWRNKRG